MKFNTGDFYQKLKEIHVLLKSDRNNRHFTWRPT